VPDERAGVRVAFDAVVFHQNYAVLRRFAEAVPAIGRHRHHPSVEREIVPCDIRRRGRASAASAGASA
jgi:hypothetical protein